MQYQHQNLKFQITQVSKQWRRLILLQGSAQVLLFTIVVFLLALLLDSLLELHHFARIALLAVTAGVFITTLVLRVIRPLLNLPSEARIARYLEETYPQLEDRLVTAVEFQDLDKARTSRLILEKLLEDTRFHIAPLNLRKSLKSKAPVLWSSVALAASVFVAALLLSNFSMFSFQMNRVLTPWEFPTIAPTPGLRVLPGDARVPKNSVQEIRAEISGFLPESVALYYSEDDSTWNKTEMDASVENGVYLYNFFSLNQDTKYYVKAGDELSDIYEFTLYEAPSIKRVDLRYTYPDYTGLSPKTEVDSGDIWAPEGTRVAITAVADKPLKAAEFVQGADKQLKTSIVNDTLATASLTVARDSYYRITLTDHDNLSNQPPPEYYIHALPDQPPLLTLERPGRDIKASMVEEVPIEIRVQDDYGIPAVKLQYSINGDEEKQIDLNLERISDSKQGIQEFNGKHLFYLETLDVQPGDFLTYYFRAGEDAATEIFFIEVRPFEQQFFRALSQGEMGGSGGGAGGRLSQTQKEIVVATWKLVGRKAKLSPDELATDTQVILDSQQNLQEVTESALLQMQQRSLFSGEGGDDISKYYTEAADAMQRAIEQLKSDNLESALPPEKEALAALLSAEAQLKEIQVQQGQGAGNMADIQQLSEMFEQEMDKLTNKYETLRNNQQQRSNEELNETLEKVKELARRQQQFNQRMRDLAKQSKEEKRRQIEELRRQQDEIRRQAQELARQAQQMQQRNSALPRDIQERLRKATSEMTNASNNLRNQNTELAAAKGTHALNRLQQLEDSLRRNQKESLRRELSDLEQQFQRMADAQRKLSAEVEKLSPQQQELDESLQDARENQSQIREEMKDATERLESLVSQSRQNQNEISREMNEVKREIERSEIEKKMQQAEQLLQEKQLHSAHQAQRDLASAMEKLEQRMTQLRGLMAETEEEKLDLALNQTRRLRDQLESMQREVESLQRSEAGDRREGEQTAGEGGQPSQAGPGESKRPGKQLDPEKLDWWNEQLAKSRDDLEMLQQSIRIDSSLARDASRINQNLQGMVRTFSGGTADRWQLIEQQVLEPLKNLEAELAQKLELLKNKEKLFLARDEQIPSEYKELVEKYYEVLSRTQE